MLNLHSFIPDLNLFKILIAGEDAPQRRNIRHVLQALGFTNFREAEDGDEALRKLKAQKLDFLFCHVDLPLKDGGQLLKSLRASEELKTVPLILLAEINQEDAAASTITGQADGYLVLPLLPQIVEDKILELLFAGLRPSEFDIHLQGAGELMAKGKYREAHAELDRADEITPGRPIVNYFRRLVFEYEGRLDEAENAANQAREAFVKVITGPGKAVELIARGRKLLGEENVMEAEEAFTQARTLDPNNRERMLEIGEAYLDHGYIEKADRVFNESLAKAPGDIGLLNRLALAHKRQGRLDQALLNYQRAVDIDPHEENLRYNVAKVHLALGDRAGAISSLEKAMEIHPNFKEARALLERLKKRAGGKS